MPHIEPVRSQTLVLRRQIAKLLGDLASRADVVPPRWRNNAWWHAGHLVVTPRLLTHGLRGAPDLGVPPAYRTLFAKGTTPDAWPSDRAGVPAVAHLIEEVLEASERLFDELEGEIDAPFAKPYTTSIGLVLETPAQALSFSLAHDGIHFGLLMALSRALDA